MKIIEKILESEFRMTLLENKINIVNYKKIEDLTEEKIVITAKKIIEIKGSNLTLKKMMNNELLITGTIKKIDII